MNSISLTNPMSNRMGTNAEETHLITSARPEPFLLLFFATDPSEMAKKQYQEAKSKVVHSGVLSAAHCLSAKHTGV